MDRRGRRIPERDRGSPGSRDEEEEDSESVDGPHQPMNQDSDATSSRRSLLHSTISEIRSNLQSSPAYTSGSLSLSLDSQPPGPSGLSLHFPTIGPGSHATNVSCGGGGGPSHPGPTSGSAVPQNRAGVVRTSPFLVSPSQDLLTSQGSQDDGNLLSGNDPSPVPHGSGPNDPATPPPPVPAAFQASSVTTEMARVAQRMRLDSEERQRRGHQALMNIMDRGRNGAGGSGGGGPGARGRVETGGTQRTQGATAQIQGNHGRRSFADGAVPSSSHDLSSDDLFENGHGGQRGGVGREEDRGVPEAQPVPTVFGSYKPDQVVHMTTTESDMSSSEPQALSKQPSSSRSRVHKVPRLSTRQLQKVNERSRLQEQEPSSPDNVSSRRTSSSKLTSSAASHSDTSSGHSDVESAVSGVKRPRMSKARDATPMLVLAPTTPMESSSSDKSLDMVVVVAGLSGVDSESTSQVQDTCSEDLISPPDGSQSLLMLSGHPTGGDQSSDTTTSPPATGVVRMESSTSTTSATSTSGSSGGEPVKMKATQSLQTGLLTSDSGVQSPDELPDTRDLANQGPRWCAQLRGSELGESSVGVASRKLSRQSSPSSDSDQSSPSTKAPPAKRRRENSRSSSSTDVPKLQTGNTEAQPAYSIPSALSKKSTHSASVGRQDSNSPLSGQKSDTSPLSQRCSGSSSGSSTHPSSSSSSGTHSSTGGSSSDMHPSSGGSGGGADIYRMTSSGSSSSAQPQSSDKSSSSYERTISSNDSVSEESPNISLLQQTPSPNKAMSSDHQVGTRQSVDSTSPLTKELSADEEATVESTMEPSVEAIMLNNSIFENIQSSDESEVEIVESPKDIRECMNSVTDSANKKDPVDLSAHSAHYVQSPGNPEEDEDMEDTILYMDTDLEAQSQGSPELLQDYKGVSTISRVQLLQSPAKYDPDGAEGGVSEIEDSCVIADSQASLQLHFSQSQELSFTPVGQTSKMEAIPEVGEDSESEHGDMQREGETVIAGTSEDVAGRNASEIGGGCRSGLAGDVEQSGVENAEMSAQSKSEVKLVSDSSRELVADEKSPLDVENRKEPLYESIIYDDDDDPTSDVDEAPHSGKDARIDEDQPVPPKSSNSQASEISQLTPSSGTPFQFQLPQGSLLKPTTSITPPPSTEIVHQQPSGTTDSSIPAVTSATGRSAEATVSPSEVKQDFFRSQTPSAVEGTPEVRVLTDSPSEPMAVQTSSSKGDSTHTVPRQSKSPEVSVPEPMELQTSTPNPSCAAANPKSSLSPSTVCTPSRTTKRKLLSLGKEGKSKGRFEMGVSPEDEEDSMLNCSSSPPLPQIEVPSGSQFESSANSETFFKILKPPLNQSTASESEMDTDAGTEEKQSLLSDVRANVQKPDVRNGDVAADATEGGRDPYEYNSQSQDTDVQTIVHRLQNRNGRKKQNVETSIEDEITRKGHLNVQVTASNEPTTGRKQPSKKSSIIEHATKESIPSKEPTIQPSIHTTVPTNQPRVPSEEPTIRPPTVSSEEQPPLNSTRTTADRNSFHINLASNTSSHSPSMPSIRISQLVHSPHPPNPLSSPHISSPIRSRIPGHHLPSPLASTDYVSPSRSISAEGLQELRRQVAEQSGREAEPCELRYVRTVCTVIEERFISSELVENGVVVPGSGKSWPESSRPYTTQEIRVELVPRVTPSSHPPSTPSSHISPSIVLSPFTHRVSSPLPGSYDHFRLPHPTHSLLSPGRSPNTFTHHPPQSPLSTAHHSASPQKKTTSHHEKTPERATLRLEDAPTKFQSTRSASSEVLPAQEKVLSLSDVRESNKHRDTAHHEEEPIDDQDNSKVCSPVVTHATVHVRKTPSTSPGKIYDMDQDNSEVCSPVVTHATVHVRKTPSTCPSKIYDMDAESSLGGPYKSSLLATPPLGSSGGRSKSKHNPFKVGTRLSLSSKKTRTSPRKNIWGLSSSPGRLLSMTGGKGGGARPKGGRKVGGGKAGESTSSVVEKSNSPRLKTTKPFYAAKQGGKDSRKRTLAEASTSSPGAKKSRLEETPSALLGKSPSGGSRLRGRGGLSTASSDTVNGTSPSTSGSGLRDQDTGRDAMDGTTPSTSATRLRGQRISTRGCDGIGGTTPSTSGQRSTTRGRDAVDGTTPSTSGQRSTTKGRDAIDGTTPSTSGSRLRDQGSSTTSMISDTKDRLVLDVGDRVIARWATDRRWYVATIRGKTKSRYTLAYADGERGSVGPSQLFLQRLLRKNDPVMAGRCEDDGLPEVNGTFEGFSSDGESFSLRVSKDKTESCDIGRFSISQDTALEYTRPNRSSPSISRTPQRRGTEGTPSARRRRREGFANLDQECCLPEEDEVVIEDFLSPSQASLFHGYTFLLTQRMTKDDSSSQDKPISKQEMTSLILNRRGRVLETYRDERITDGRWFVLSDDHCRTQKYLLGLALAIPCVSYDWIKSCMQQGIITDYLQYRLPAGIPHMSKEPLEWIPRGRSSVLRGVHTYIYHSETDFKDHWSIVLKYSGATVLSKLPSTNKILRSNQVGRALQEVVVISEAGCKLPSSITSRVDLTMKVLGTEWIVQSLIRGRQVEYEDFLS